MSFHFISELHRQIRISGIPVDTDAGTPAPIKIYPRFEQLPLPNPTPPTMTLAEALSLRRSSRDSMSGAPISLEEFSTLLSVSMRMCAKTRPYPSGGGLYPLELYIISFAIEHLPRATLHYRPDTHVLERLWDLAPNAVPFDFFSNSYGRGFCEKASALLVITSVWRRSAEKYGERAYPLSLLEAGHATQNITLAATSLNLASRPFYGFRDAAIMKLLDLEEQHEQPIYCVALGTTLAG